MEVLSAIKVKMDEEKGKMPPGMRK